MLLNTVVWQWLKTHRLLEKLPAAAVSPKQLPETAVSSGQWVWGEVTFSFCANPRWSLRSNKAVVGLELCKEGRDPGKSSIFSGPFSLPDTVDRCLS